MFIQTAFNFSSVVQRLVCRFSGLRLLALRRFPALAYQAQAAIVLVVLRSLGGAVLFRS